MMKKMIGINKFILLVISLSISVCSLNSIMPHKLSFPEITEYTKSDRVYAPTKYVSVVREIAEKVRVDVDLLCAVIKVESNWDHLAIGTNTDSVDRGLGQINSKYEPWYVDKFGISSYEWCNPKKNIELTARVLKWSSKGFNHMVQGIAAYNCGRARVHKNEWPETTKKYVKKVLFWYNYYKNCR